MGKRSQRKKANKEIRNPEAASAPSPDSLLPSDAPLHPESPSRQKRAFFFLAAWSLVALAVAAVYHHVLDTPFQFDDHRTVVSNLSIRHFQQWGAMFRFAPSRFLLTLSFALDYHFWELNPWGYHLTNLVIHAFNGMLVYTVLASGALGRAASRFGVALSAALLFSVHPFNTEGVAYISSRSSSLSTFFVLAVFWAYLRYVSAPSRLRYALAFSLFLVGLPTKETVATVPLILLFWEVFFGGHASVKKLFEKRRAALAGFFAIPALGLAARTFVAGAPETLLFRPYGTHLLTEAKVFFINLGLFLFPHGLSVDHDITEIGLRHGSAWLALLALTALLAGAWRFRTQAPGLGFGALWAFSTYLPLMLIPLQDVMTEHWAYLSNLGWLFALAWGAGKLLSGRPEKKRTSSLSYALAAASLALVVGFGLAAYERNKVWESDITLWRDATEKAPQKGRPWVNLAAAQFKQGDFDGALSSYETASTRPGAYLPRVYLGMGRIYFEQKHDLDNGEKFLLKAVEYGPEVWDAWSRLGYIEHARGNCQKAVEYMERSRERAREDFTLQFMLGDCYLKLGQTAKARDQFLWACLLRKNDFFTLLRLGQVYEATREWEHALGYYGQALRLKPNDRALRQRMDYVRGNLKRP